MTYNQTVIGYEQVLVDNEHGTVEASTVNGYSAVSFRPYDAEGMYLIWTDGEYAYYIFTTYDLSEAVKIAEGIY